MRKQEISLAFYFAYCLEIFRGPGFLWLQELIELDALLVWFYPITLSDNTDTSPRTTSMDYSVYSVYSIRFIHYENFQLSGKQVCGITVELPCNCISIEMY